MLLLIKKKYYNFMESNLFDLNLFQSSLKLKIAVMGQLCYSGVILLKLKQLPPTFTPEKSQNEHNSPKSPYFQKNIFVIFFIEI